MSLEEAGQSYWAKEEQLRWRAYRAHAECRECESCRGSSGCPERRKLLLAWEEAARFEFTEFRLLNGIFSLD